MTPDRTYGWKLATFRLPTAVYTFEVVDSKSGDDDTVELVLKITAPVEYMGHRIRTFVPKGEWEYLQVFEARLHDDYGIIIPDTVRRIR